MRKSRFALFCVVPLILLLKANAFAGTCPGAANYGFPNYSSTLSSVGITACYFIDMTSGSDSNTGTDEAHPWQHSPEMANASANALAHAVKAGDGYIFKGGSSCSSTCFPITISTSGTSSNPIYYGYDPSWGTGRPAWNAAGTPFSGGNVMLKVGAATYRIFDNFDVSGLADNNDNTYGHNVMFSFNSDYVTFSHNYFHGWFVNGATYDDMVGILGCNGCGGSNQTHSVVDMNYCNGADANPPSTSNGSGSFECLRYIAGGTISNNIIRNVSNAAVFGGAGATVYGNDWGFIYGSFDPTDHENIMEFQVGGNIVYNNLYHDAPVGSGAWPMPLAPSAGTTDWVFNNICWNVGRDCVSIDTQGNFPSYSVYLINNTWIPASGSVCADTTDRGAGNSIGSAYVINNHCITSVGTQASGLCFSGNSACSTVTQLKTTTNTFMASTNATLQGYSSSQQYVYSPTASSNSTVGAGTNESSLAVGSVVALASETTYACSVNQNNQVSCPGRTALSRGNSCTPVLGVSGCWDTGAHLFAQGNSVAAPTNLQAAVQ